MSDASHQQIMESTNIMQASQQALGNGSIEGNGKHELTSRQYQIAELVSKGHSNKEIAYILNLSESTVKQYMMKIFWRMEVTNRVAVAMKFIEIFNKDKSIKVRSAGR